MPNFEIINNPSEITLDNKWVSVSKFNSKNKLFDEKGHEVSSDYKGRQYRIIEKRERTFSALERFGRGLLGMVSVIFTFSLGLFFSKSIRNLFTKSKANIRFAVEETPGMVTTRKVMKAFLKDLRENDLLLMEEEFNKLDKNKYISELDHIGCIQGKNFIEKLVKENQLKHIKVPKKIVVINEGLENISFQLAHNLELIPKENQLQIYAEKIKPLDRKHLSLEEAKELMIILEKTGYSNFLETPNIFVCEDGIYFTDTNYKHFSPLKPEFGYIESLKHCVDPEDAEKFLETYEKRKNDYDNEKKLREDQQEYLAALENPYKQLTTGHEKHEFVFSLASLGIKKLTKD